MVANILFFSPLGANPRIQVLFNNLKIWLLKNVKFKNTQTRRFAQFYLAEPPVAPLKSAVARLVSPCAARYRRLCRE